MTRRFRFSSRAPGRANSIYEATAPDGSRLQRASFMADAPTAWMRIVKIRGKWTPQIVLRSKEESIHSSVGAQWIECRRIG